MRRLPWEWLCVAAAVLVVLCTLFVRPLVGMADNGDFERVMITAGLDYHPAQQPRVDRYFAFVHTHFAAVERQQLEYLSTHVLAVLAAKALDGVLTRDGLLDIRFLAALYALGLLTAFFLLVRLARQKLAWPAAAVAAAFLVWVFADVGYLAYFNSLYGEPASLVSLLLMLAVGLWLSAQERPTLWGVTLLFLAAGMFVGAKVQNTPLALLASLLLLRLWTRRRDGLWRGTVTAYAVALLAIAGAVYQHDPPYTKICNLYQSVFTGVLKDSPSPAEDLAALGLDPKYLVLAGTDCYQEGTAIPQNDPELVRHLLERINVVKVAGFYLTHPWHLLDKLDKSTRAGAYIRPSYLGNYPKEAGKPPVTFASGFDTWSSLRPLWLPQAFWGLALYLAAWLYVWARRWRAARTAGERFGLETLLLVPAIGTVQFAVPFIGSGEADFSKHLFLFVLALDVMLVVSAVWVAQAVAGLVSARAGEGAARRPSSDAPGGVPSVDA
jgi:hypothetical protein